MDASAATEVPPQDGPPSRWGRPPSQRRRFLAGVAAAAALAVGLGAWLQHRAQEAELQARVERSAVITLSALADLVESASLPTEEVTADEGGIDGEPAAPDAEAEGEEPAADGSPQTIRLFAARHPEVQAVRVVFFDGQRLAASTAREDTGVRAAPRRLMRGEKPLYDLGRRLRVAVEANRVAAEGGETATGARRREIAVQRQADVLVLTAPVERDTAVVGLLQIETPAPPRLPGAGWILLQALVAAAGAALAFWLLSLLLGERRWALAAAAMLLLLAALLLFRQRTLALLADSRRAGGQAVAAHLAAERTRAEEVLAVTGGAASALNPAFWDVDAFRRPHGLVAVEGAVAGTDADAARRRLEAQLAAGAARFTRGLLVCGLLGLALLALVGFGGAARGKGT